MAGRNLGEGPLTIRWVHAAPFHSHVSPMYRLFVSTPPKRTATPRAASYAIACAYRGDGPAAIRCAQAPPFHSHVSPLWVERLSPPKRTVIPRAASYAIAG